MAKKCLMSSDLSSSTKLILVHSGIMEQNFDFEKVYKRLEDCVSPDTGTSCKEKFRKDNLETVFVVAKGRFLSYWSHQLIKFEEEKIFRLKKQF